MAENRSILPSVTTVHKADWRQALKDLEDLQVKQFAVFLTGLSSSERSDLYHILEDRKGIRIPFVHAVSEMTPEEYRYLMDTFGTKKFNLHTLRSWPLKYPLGELTKYIYIENSGVIPTQADLEGFAGLLIDMSHLENTRLSKPKDYQDLMNLIRTNPVGANHISAILKQPVTDRWGFHYDMHRLTDLTQLNYLKDIPDYCFGGYQVIELSNSIKEQLEVIEYIQKNNLTP